MKKLLFFALFLLSNTSIFSQNNLKVWYNKPARTWNEALPLGNGRIGAMVFGRVGEELIQLNEQTLWSGKPVNPNPNPGVAQYLPQVREALMNEDYPQAHKLTQKIQGLYSEAYMPMGDLLIHQKFEGEPTEYYRDIDIQNATAITRFKVGSTTFTREMFISAPDQVMVLRLKSSTAKGLNVKVSVKSQLRYLNSILGEKTLVMKGKAPSHSDPSYVRHHTTAVIEEDSLHCGGTRFELRLKVQSTDGQVVIDNLWRASF